MRRMFAVIVLLLPFAAAAQDCPAGRTPIAVLGVYHMTGGGTDLIKTNPEDPRSPKRQAEIEAVVEKLAAFRPTKVAIESAHWQTVWTDRYRQWRAGTYTMGTNEIEHLGFRLAAKMNHDRLWPVDYPMWMSGETPAEQHRPKPRAASKPPAPPEEPAEEIKAIFRQVEADQQRLKNTTVGEYLAYMNTPERYRLNHQWDVMMNLVPGDGAALYEKTDLATNWYKRNLRIVTNVVEVTEPDDRILLIIGAGHLAVLNDLFDEHPLYCRVDVVPLLR
jgi:hypothetical protein